MAPGSVTSDPGGTGVATAFAARGASGITFSGSLSDAIEAEGPYGMTSGRRLPDAIAATAPYGMTGPQPAERRRRHRPGQHRGRHEHSGRHEHPA